MKKVLFNVLLLVSAFTIQSKRQVSETESASVHTNQKQKQTDSLNTTNNDQFSMESTQENVGQNVTNRRIDLKKEEESTIKKKKSKKEKSKSSKKSVGRGQAAG